MTSYPLSFREAYTHQLNIPVQFTEALTEYKLLYWSAEYFIKKWEEGIGTLSAGTIHRKNKLFHVQFCSGMSLDKIKHMEKSAQVKLSFRAAPNLPAYVLVTASNQIRFNFS